MTVRSYCICAEEMVYCCRLHDTTWCVVWYADDESDIEVYDRDLDDEAHLSDAVSFDELADADYDGDEHTGSKHQDSLAEHHVLTVEDSEVLLAQSSLPAAQHDEQHMSSALERSAADAATVDSHVGSIERSASASSSQSASQQKRERRRWSAPSPDVLDLAYGSRSTSLTDEHQLLHADSLEQQHVHGSHLLTEQHLHTKLAQHQQVSIDTEQPAALHSITTVMGQSPPATVVSLVGDSMSRAGTSTLLDESYNYTMSFDDDADGDDSVRELSVALNYSESAPHSRQSSSKLSSAVHTVAPAAIHDHLVEVITASILDAMVADAIVVAEVLCYGSEGEYQQQQRQQQQRRLSTGQHSLDDDSAVTSGSGSSDIIQPDYLSSPGELENCNARLCRTLH